MTQDPKNIILIEEPFEDKCLRILSEEENEAVKKYLESGGKKLSTETAASFFSMYLNGYDTKEIFRLNKAFPYESILIAKVTGDWDKEKEDYLNKLQENIKEKLLKAQLESINFLSDLLSATHKKHGDKIKKFLTSGNEKDLEGTMSVDSVSQLLKVVEGLNKVTGQDRPKANDTTINVNIDQRSVNNISSLSPEDSAKILNIVSESKRKGNKNG
jgi:hypothetical protein